MENEATEDQIKAINEANDLPRDYDGAMKGLNCLMSNAASIANWKKERTTNKEATAEAAMNALLKRSNIDISNLSVIHITGTKGKGSTCAIIDSILRQFSLPTFLFTSPNLVHPRERLRFCGQSISKPLFALHFWKLWDSFFSTRSHPCDMPSYFRYLTLMFFSFCTTSDLSQISPSSSFSTALRPIILEVGIGGRTDPTNITPQTEVCGINIIDYDHCELLGNTLESIAWEKSGIFKPGCFAFSVDSQTKEVQKVLEDRAKEKQVFNNQITYTPTLPSNYHLTLDGAFQRDNAGLALEITKQYLTHHKIAIDEDKIKTGLYNAKWPGRAMELNNIKLSKSEDNIKLYLDGAHTINSVRECIKWYKSKHDIKEDKGEKRVLMFNCKQNRNARELMREVWKEGGASKGGNKGWDRVVFCNVGVGEDLGTEWQEKNREIWGELEEEYGKEGKKAETVVYGMIGKGLDDVLEYGRKNKGRRVEVLVTGSLYLVGGVLEVLIERGVLEESIVDL
eukprot:TRINITY_DN2626_c0_g1_i3.p1 TRINITY_DN2626_c0_g1~~TRINITY_DN2626_c0_g1_i3.p1  ORF type:complete len:510 (-),score=154.00 TRINITY_DN2626_c0_g1_i3:188-1717(-)